MSRIWVLLFFSILTLNSWAGKLTRTHKTDLAVTWVDEYKHEYVYVPGLTNDLFKTYEENSSNGPRWKKKAIDELSDHFDFHENSSYWGERENGRCKFPPHERDYVEDKPLFVWKSVKKLNKKPNPNSVFYLVNYYTSLHLEGRTCNLFERQFVFLNQLDSNGTPIYLGERSHLLPKFR